MTLASGHVFRHLRAAAPVAALLMALLVVLGGCGITAPRGNDGYANLDSPGMLDTDRTVSLSLGPTVLGFAARFLDEDPETQALLRSLDGVRVRTYEVRGDSDQVAQRLERMGNRLSDDGWNPVMLVREEGELVQMFAKASSDGIKGLTVVSADAEEVVVINVMGDIRPADFGATMTALAIDETPAIQVATAN